MKKFVVIAVCICLYACSAGRLSNTEISENYIPLNVNNYQHLSGVYRNLFTNNLTDAITDNGFFASNFLQKAAQIPQDKAITDSLINTIEIKVIDAKRLRVDFGQQNFIIKGKFKRGFFYTKNKSTAHFPIIIPIFWGISGKKYLIGLSKENNLTILSRDVGLGFITVLPIMSAANLSRTEFERLK